MAKPMAAPSAAKREEVRAGFDAFAKERTIELRNALVTQCMPLVRSVAGQYARTVEQRDDLEQVGSLGLIKAVERFDPTLGVPFEAYARTLIAGEISHYLRDLAPLMRIPRWYRRLNQQLHAAAAKLQNELQREPTTQELAAATNITVEGVNELLRLRQSYNLISLSDSGPGADDRQPRVELIKHQRLSTFQLPVEDQIALDRAIETLAAFERRVIYLFFYKDLTQTEIAARLGFSQKHISRTIAASVVKLKARIG